jgi:hypothetical protein
VATADDVHRIALSLAGTTAAPHMDRTAFRVRRIYATLAADGRSVNLKLSPEEQEFKAMMAPAVFAAIPNGWGRQGWTTVDLTAIEPKELVAALTMAWEHGRAK